MPNEVDYLPVANGSSSIAEPQATWASDLAGPLANGFPSGVVTSPRFNKVLRQTSMISAAIANFISQQLNINVLDDGNLPGLITNLTNAIKALVPSLTGYAPLASPVFTGTPSAPTQAAADNSTKLATTGFVATAIAAVQAWVTGLGYATQSWVTGLAYATQAWVTAQGFATTSWVEAWVFSLGYATSSWVQGSFSASITANGYIKVPPWLGGLVLQWGQSGNVAGDTNIDSITVSYPVQFPNNVFAAVAVANSPSPGSHGGTVAHVVSPNVNYFTLTLINADSNNHVGSVAAYWIAVGN
jgi:hypothetical protein